MEGVISLMAKNSSKKEYFLIGLIIILFVLMSGLSLVSMQQLRGNARVVNYTGIVRGATQRLIKKELQGSPDDSLISRLDSIVEELTTGEGPNGLVVLRDETFLSHMGQVTLRWAELKSEISKVRAGGSPDYLFELSEDYFTLCDNTVTAAERYSEQQVNRSMSWMIGINVVFILLLSSGVFILLRTSSLKKRADILGKIAYVDPLTQMPNRACCQQEIDRLSKACVNQQLLVFMFDMNNLKRVNDQLGHQGGDRIIADFARIIKTEGSSYGFVGRYGGDEFIAIFPNGDETIAQTYLKRVNEKLVSYNLLHVREIEKVSYAAGYFIASVTDVAIAEMIDEADRRMYIRKRQMKENKET